MEPVKCGYLQKQGGFVKSWKKRWFILWEDKAEYYSDEFHIDEKGLKGTIDLRGAKILDGPEKDQFSVVTPQRTYPIICKSESERLKWMAAFTEVAEANADASITNNIAQTYEVSDETADSSNGNQTGTHDSSSSSVGQQAEKVVRFTDPSNPAEKEGYLEKQGGSVKTWKKRYFILKDQMLTYYASPKAAAQNESKGGFSLVGTKGKVKDQKTCTFSIKVPSGRKYLMRAAGLRDFGRWLKAISASVGATKPAEQTAEQKPEVSSSTHHQVEQQQHQQQQQHKQSEPVEVEEVVPLELNHRKQSEENVVVSAEEAVNATDDDFLFVSVADYETVERKRSESVASARSKDPRLSLQQQQQQEQEQQRQQELAQQQQQQQRQQPVSPQKSTGCCTLL